MLDIDSRAELAPRDIVARAIAEQIHNNGLGYVHLDVSHLSAEFLREHFPQIYQTLLDLGIDITTDPIPVAPTAHYSCGGVVTCTTGLTDVRGLYAAGEVAYTGLHGANRLASNSLLECVVIGRNIAAHLPTYLLSANWSPVELTNTKSIHLPSSNLMTERNYNNQAKLNTTHHINDITAKLKALMSQNMGITRSADLLAQALVKIQGWQQAIQLSGLDDLTGLSNLDIIDNATTPKHLLQFRLERQLQLATLIVQSAYQRCESRGGHYRKDYPAYACQPLISVIEPVTDKANNLTATSEWLSISLSVMNCA